MQETVKINYVQYRRGSKKNKGKSRPNGCSGGSGSSVNPGARKVPCIPQMERQDLQAIILHYNSQCITNLLSRDGCYMLGVLKLCYSVETLKRSSAQPTTDLEQHQMHGKSFLHWTDEGTGEEKLSNSTQQFLNKDELQGISLKQQDILRVYSVVTTGIGKSLDTPSKFQLQPNEEITQHAPRQVPNHTQEQPGNQSTVKPGKEMVGMKTVLR